MSEQQPMTTDEFFAEAKRLNLRAPMNHEDMCAAFDAKDAEIAQLRAELSRLQAAGGQAIGEVGGDEATRSMQWAPGVDIWTLPVGMKLYAAHPPAAPAIDIKAARSFLASFANWKPDPLDDDKHRRALTIALDYLDDLIGPHAKPAAPALVPMDKSAIHDLCVYHASPTFWKHYKDIITAIVRDAEKRHGINGLTVGGDGGVKG